jgi:hypothetical protein
MLVTTSTLTGKAEKEMRSLSLTLSPGSGTVRYPALMGMLQASHGCMITV